MHINSKQRKMSILGVVLIIGMCVFPPWIYTFKVQGAYSENPAGYSFIAEPPERPYRQHNNKDLYGVKIDLNRLTIQVFAVIAFIGLGLLVFNQSAANTGNTEKE